MKSTVKQLMGKKHKKDGKKRSSTTGHSEGQLPKTGSNEEIQDDCASWSRTRVSQNKQPTRSIHNGFHTAEGISRNGSTGRPLSIDSGISMTSNSANNETLEGMISTPSATREKSKHKKKSTTSDLHILITICLKHPRHVEFIPVCSLDPRHLHPPFQSQAWVDLIQLKAVSTVKLTVSSTNQDRPETIKLHGVEGDRHGSGTAFLFNMRHDEPCGCNEIEGEHRVSGVFKILTAAHVVYDNVEARSTQIQFSFDSQEGSAIVEAWGEGVSLVEVGKNRTVIDCRSHDLTLWRRLQEAQHERERLIREELEPMASGDSMVVLISHPHGMSKHVSLGELVTMTRDNNVRTIPGGIKLAGCVLTYTTPACIGCGGGSVNVFGAGVTCAAFAPHFATKDNLEGVSGEGWARVL